MPVPVDAAIEGQDGLACDNANGDCHLLVVQGTRLYEAYRANASGAGGLQAQCLAVWFAPSSESCVARLGERVVHDGDASPVVDGVPEPGVTGRAADDRVLLAAALGHRRDTCQSAERRVVSCTK